MDEIIGEEFEVIIAKIFNKLWIETAWIWLGNVVIPGWSKDSITLL